MSNFPVSGKIAVKAFIKAGWSLRGQVGSHMVLTKPGMKANLSIPNHKVLAAGTLRRLIRSAGMDISNFIDLIK